MNKTTGSFQLATCALAAMAMCIGSNAEAAPPSKAKQSAEPVAFSRMNPYLYHNFVKNWDNKRHPVLYALIRNPADYQRIFNAAATNGDRGPFAPESALYDKEQILLVSRVTASIDAKVYAVESLTVLKDTLTLRYKFQDSSSPAMEKSMLQLRLPKHTYKQVILVENGKQIGKLNIGNGQWVVPAPKKD